jgi:tripartite-type tricarboxylate transporter receptor subunit TctC
MKAKTPLLTRRSFNLLALAAAAPLSVRAQAAWPAKPLRLIAGYPAGSSPDVLARLLAEPLGRALGQPVVVDNKPGAGGNIGADLIAKAQDDHTFGIIGNGPLTTAPFLYTKLPYQPAKDLAPIALIGSAPLIWVVAKLPPGTTAQAFVAQARAQGEKLAYGSIGLGSGTHLGMELVQGALGLKALHVPFAGGPAIINAMIGGQVQMALLPVSTVMPLVQSGKLDALAVTSQKRNPLAPTLPTLDELGAKGVTVEVWNALMAPARMEARAQARLADEAGKLLNSREMRQKLFLQGWVVGDTDPKALSARIAQDARLYRELIERNGIRIE